MTGAVQDGREPLMRLLHDRDVVAFVQGAATRYCPRGEFEKLPLPQGLDPECAWELVSFVRRVNGVPSVRDVDAAGGLPLDRHAFWTVTPQTSALLYDILAEAGPLSALWGLLERYRGRRDVRLLVAEELAAAALRDGLGRIDYEVARALVLGERDAEGDEERIVSHAAALVDELVAYPLESIDAETIAGFQQRLFQGVGEGEGYRPYSPPHPPAVSVMKRRSPADVLEDIVANYRNRTQWGPSPLLSVIINADMVWEHRPFPCCNGLMEVLLRVAALGMYGVPALCYVPLSRMRLDWERDLTDASRTPFRQGEALVTSGFGVDSTPYLNQMVVFLKEGLERLEGVVDRLRCFDGACKAKIAADGRLNHRQRDLLQDMVDDPALEVDVHGYQERYGVVTSTARADLNRLVALRLILDGFRGRRQVFWARPGMEGNLLAE